MASETTLEHAYSYRDSWRSTGCGVLIYGMMGGAALALIPFGYEKLQNGAMPIGVAMIVGGLFGAPMLFMAVVSLIVSIRESFSPPLLRITPTSLLLPDRLRGTVARDESGELKPDEVLFNGHPVKPPDGSRQGTTHPEEIPFSAIRSVRREGAFNPGSDKLVITHDLTPVTLVIERYMMKWGDFDELESVLLTAIPAAFAAALPAPPPTT